MVQGIYNVKNGQPVGVVYFGEGGNLVYGPKPQEPDSFNGKTLLTIAAVAGAVIFRKNIMNKLAPFIAKHPKLAEGLNTATKYVSDFYKKHADNSLVKLVKEGWDKTGTWGDSIVKWFKGFNKPKIIQTEFDFK